MFLRLGAAAVFGAFEGDLLVRRGKRYGFGSHDPILAPLCAIFGINRCPFMEPSVLDLDHVVLFLFYIFSLLGMELIVASVLVLD